jgi:hypothetical protein
MEEMMALLFNNIYILTSHNGKRHGNIIYIGVFKDDALIWWNSIDYFEWRSFFEREIKELLLYKWSRAKIKDK